MPTVAAPLPDLTLYTRPGCHLCDEAREAIEAVLIAGCAAGDDVIPARLQAGRRTAMSIR